MEQARLKGADVSEKVALMAERHIGYLSDGTDNAKEDARKLMTQTRERAMTCQETALKKMAQGDPEKAARLNLQLMERQLNRIRTRAEEGKEEAVRARVEAYNRLGNLGQEISQFARGLGQETSVDQLVGMATAHHLEVLAQVQERVQGRTQEAVQAAVENCIQNHERLVTRLQERNQVGNVPEELPNANMSRIGRDSSPHRALPAPPTQRRCKPGREARLAAYSGDGKSSSE
jgi:hypothetical protein